ncbi:MAG: hypothetical protein ABIE43_00800 [Patescibacteria group bacterium]
MSLIDEFEKKQRRKYYILWPDGSRKILGNTKREEALEGLGAEVEGIKREEDAIFYGFISVFDITYGQEKKKLVGYYEPLISQKEVVNA